MSKKKTKAEIIENLRKRSDEFSLDMQKELDSVLNFLMSPYISASEWRTAHSAIYGSMQTAFMAGVKFATKRILEDISDVDKISREFNKKMFLRYKNNCIYLFVSLVVNYLFLLFFGDVIARKIAQVFL